MRYISETVQHAVFTGTTANARGNQGESWATPTDLGIYAFNPGTSQEVLIDGHMHRVETKPTIYLPSTAVVGNRDKITARGVTYEVDGDPADFRNPYDSTMNGLSIDLKVVSG